MGKNGITVVFKITNANHPQKNFWGKTLMAPSRKLYRPLLITSPAPTPAGGRRIFHLPEAPESGWNIESDFDRVRMIFRR